MSIICLYYEQDKIFICFCVSRGGGKYNNNKDNLIKCIILEYTHCVKLSSH